MNTTSTPMNVNVVRLSSRILRSMIWLFQADGGPESEYPDLCDAGTRSIAAILNQKPDALRRVLDEELPELTANHQALMTLGMELELSSADIPDEINDAWVVSALGGYVFRRELDFENHNAVVDMVEAGFRPEGVEIPEMGELHTMTKTELVAVSLAGAKIAKAAGANIGYDHLYENQKLSVADRVAIMRAEAAKEILEARG